MFLFIIYNPTQIGSLNIDETNRLASVYVILIIVSHRHHWQHLVRVLFLKTTRITPFYDCFATSWKHAQTRQTKHMGITDWYLQL
jgi:hypothetical protein